MGDRDIAYSFLWISNLSHIVYINLKISVLIFTNHANGNVNTF